MGFDWFYAIGIGMGRERIYFANIRMNKTEEKLLVRFLTYSDLLENWKAAIVEKKEYDTSDFGYGRKPCKLNKAIKDRKWRGHNSRSDTETEPGLEEKPYGSGNGIFYGFGKF